MLKTVQESNIITTYDNDHARPHQMISVVSGVIQRLGSVPGSNRNDKAR